MYTQIKAKATNFRINKETEGETIETKVERMVTNKEPIKERSELIYTERKDGVIPAYNVRTDRFDLAIEAMDTASKVNTARREERLKIVKGGESESEPGTDGNGTDGGGQET